METEIIKIARRIQAISQTGIWFTKDVFDKQRFEELREISVELMSLISNTPVVKISELFTADSGFQTPKTDIRAVVLKDNKILMVRERMDNKWSLPGGYADINITPSENAVKEVFEETGIVVKPNRILAVIDTNKHGFPPMPFHFYKIIILCDYFGGNLTSSEETSEAAFFGFDSLPLLSLLRNTYQMMDLVKNLIDVNIPYFD